MLLLENRFMMVQGIRNVQYFNNPNIVSNSRFHLPQHTIIHYIDQSTDNKFPNRNHYYFRVIDESKRIRVHNVTEFTRVDSVVSIKNKKVNADIQNWKNTHRDTFKLMNSLEESLEDKHNTTVVNYNLLKDKYRYGSSVISQYNKTYNLMKTFADTLKEQIDKNKNKLHLVTLDIPLIIPGYNTMKRIMNFNSRKLVQTLVHYSEYWLFEWYKWLVDDNRPNSVFSKITDNDSTKILLEIRFKGYSTYVKLSTLRGMSSNSNLESMRKLDDRKLLKFFIVFLNQLQEEITKLSNEGVETVNELDDDSDVDSTDIGDESDVQSMKRPKVDEFTNVSKVNLEPIETPDITDDEIFELEELGHSDIFDELDKYDDIGSGILSRDTLSKSISRAVGDIDSTDNSETHDDEGSVDEEPVNMEEFVTPVELDGDEVSELMSDTNLDKKIDEYIEIGTESGRLSSADIRGVKRDQEKRRRLKDPYFNKPIDEINPLNLEEVKLEGDNIEIPVNNVLVKDTFKTDKTKNFDRLYIEKYLKEDMVGVVKDLEKSGTIITDYTVEEVRSSVDSYEIHRLHLNILGYGSGPVYFRVPIVDDEGTFMVSGRKYRFRKSKQDLPIRKINDVRVALTSNYGKFFVSRTKRKAYDTDGYIIDYMKKDYLNDAEVVTKLIPGKKRLNLIKGLPNTYYAIASEFDKVITKEFTMVLNERERDSILNEDKLRDIQNKERVFLGYINSNQNILSIDSDNMVHNETSDKVYGRLIDLLKIDEAKLPRQFSSVTILGKEIPFGIVMSYYLGLTNLIRVTKTSFRLIPTTKRTPKLDAVQLVLRFEDYKLILDLDTIEKRLIFNGYLYYKDFIKGYKMSMFESKDIFLPLVEFRNCALYHLRELDMLRDLFLDSITKDVLSQMEEPTEYIPLLFRANELLATYDYPDINDPNYIRIRGYDRIPGLTYRALAEAIRENKMHNRGNRRVSLDPYKVWNMITQDSSHQSRESVNPVSYIKEDETVTLTGTDGLNSRAVPVEMRRFHKNDSGLFTESTSDSKDVAISSNLSPFAKLENIRGLVKDGFDEMSEDPAKLFSTSALVAPLIEFDDPKRINFTGIQNSHMVPSPGYRQSSLRTGYEYLIPYKTGKNYCLMAEEDGVVISKTDNNIRVRYKSGKEEAYTIGNVDTFHEGVTYKNTLVSELSEGSRFKAGDNIYYHTDFFEPDWLNPKRLVYKQNRLYSTAICSNEETYEDSSAISSRVMKEMTVNILKERTRILDFDTNIDNLVKVGDEVEPNTPLFIDTGVTENVGNLSEQSLSLLESISSISPRAKYKGVVERIEIKYNGDKEDMSPSLRRLANRLDKELYERTKGTAYEAKDNRVSGEYSTGGNKLNIDTLELKIFISVELEMGVGDKLSMANQAKSVVGKVYNYPIVGARTGKEVDAQVALVTFIYRVTTSPLSMGMLNGLLKEYGKRVADTYFNGK